MPVEDKLTQLVHRARDRSRVQEKSRRDRIILYSEGLKAKLKQTDYALNALKFHTRQPILTDTTTDQPFLPEDKVYFYSDSFWAFLCAALDVLAQIINQTNNLGADERIPSFKTVLNNLTQIDPTLNLTRMLTKIKNSNYYKNLDKYRNCGLHRRHIYVERRTTTVTTPGGYTSTGPVETNQWILCDDPYTLNPKTRQTREIVDFCEKCKNRIEGYIEDVLDLLIP